MIAHFFLIPHPIWLSLCSIIYDWHIIFTETTMLFDPNFTGIINRWYTGVIWYFEPHGKLNPGSIYLWYFDPGFNFPYGILTPGSIFCHCPLPMVYQTLSYGIMNSSLLVEMRGGFNLPWGGSKYNDKKLTPGSKYHMENWTRGQNIIGKLTPGSIYHGVQNTIWHRNKIKLIYTSQSSMQTIQIILNTDLVE
jgi:hypothetical protein